MKKIKIVGISGSLRKESFNTKLLEYAKLNIPSNFNAEIKIINIGKLPHFNQDLEAHPSIEIQKFREEIAEADALLVSIAEYNYSISSVLKNAIEWASRPYESAVLNGKILGIMGASTGMIGTARAQYHFRQMMVQTNSIVLNKPEVMVTFARDKFDSHGKLIDVKTQEKVQALVKALLLKVQN
jgi:chromate reductase